MFLLLVYSLAPTWGFLLNMLPVNLSRVLFILSILLVDLSDLQRFGILLVLKADGNLPKLIFFMLCVSLVDLWPCLFLVFFT